MSKKEKGKVTTLVDKKQSNKSTLEESTSQLIIGGIELKPIEVGVSFIIDKPKVPQMGKGLTKVIKAINKRIDNVLFNKYEYKGITLLLSNSVVMEPKFLENCTLGNCEIIFIDCNSTEDSFQRSISRTPVSNIIPALFCGFTSEKSLFVSSILDLSKKGFSESKLMKSVIVNSCVLDTRLDSNSQHISFFLNLMRVNIVNSNITIGVNPEYYGGYVRANIIMSSTNLKNASIHAGECNFVSILLNKMGMVDTRIETAQRIKMSNFSLDGYFLTGVPKDIVARNKFEFSTIELILGLQIKFGVIVVRRNNFGDVFLIPVIKSSPRTYEDGYLVTVDEIGWINLRLPVLDALLNNGMRKEDSIDQQLDLIIEGFNDYSKRMEGLSLSDYSDYEEAIGYFREDIKRRVSIVNKLQCLSSVSKELNSLDVTIAEFNSSLGEVTRDPNHIRDIKDFPF